MAGGTFSLALVPTSVRRPPALLLILNKLQTPSLILISYCSR
jgi:hypothetical protein